jgi:uncharacterized protein YihD (DUF1040 family)
MRDVKRIDRMLKLIGKIWHKVPDYRIMQLLGNPLPSGDNYFVEDEKLEELLKRAYKDLL